MKILLARPSAPNNLNFTGLLDNEPLELEYLHTALRDTVHIDYIYDALTDKYSFEQTLKREKPDIVAVTGYITQQNVMINYCETAKRIYSSIKTIIGGVHAQLNYKEFYHNDIDYICRSEDIWAFTDLIDYIAFGKGNLHQINGLCFKSENVIVNNLIPFDINMLPIPDRSHFEKHKKSYRYLELTEIATIKTSLSCPYDCSFCYCTMLNKGSYITRDIEKVVDEIEGINTDNIQIADDDFLVDINRLKKFIELVKIRNIKKTYTCYARADFVASNPDIIKELAQIGFRYFLVGLEAADDKALSNYNKKTSASVNELAIKNIKDAGAQCIGLMIADINFRKKDFDKLYKWVRKNHLSYVTVSIFTPIPGTALYEKYKNKITSNNIEDWDFLHLVLKPENLSAAAFYFYFYILFLKLYRLSKKNGAYSFINYGFYKQMLSKYLRAQIKSSIIENLNSGKNKRTD